MEHVVLTGGAGLIGSHLVDLLVDGAVPRVVVVDDFSRGLRQNLARSAGSPALEVVEADITDPHVVREVVAGADVVFHLAAIRITQCIDTPRRAFEVLGTGSFNVVEACAELGVRRLVASSSASVYGAAHDFPTTESHDHYGNATLYGASKGYLEGMLRAFHATHGLSYAALRYFNVYGPRMDTRGRYTEVLIRWMERLASGRPPIVFGDGSDSLDLVFVTDVARANLLAAAAGPPETVVNVGTGVETSLLDLARLLGRVMGYDGPVEHAEARGVSAVPRRLADTRRAADLLGFHAEVGVEAGLARLVDWWRAGHA